MSTERETVIAAFESMLAEVREQRDEARRERDAMRPLVEAAREVAHAWRESAGLFAQATPEFKGFLAAAEAFESRYLRLLVAQQLAAAVDTYEAPSDQSRPGRLPRGPATNPRKEETMATLTKQARETIKGYWFDAGEAGLRHATIAGYVRWNGYQSGWGGDRCGCPDDRCIGFHHADEDDCGCLPVLLGEYAESISRGETTYLDALTR